VLNDVSECLIILLVGPLTGILPGGAEKISPGSLLRKKIFSKKVLIDLLKVFDLVLHYMITACWESILLENERLWMISEGLCLRTS